MYSGEHPDPYHDHSFIPVSEAEMFSTTITEENVRRAIISFRNGSTDGPDGLWPQHLKDLIGLSANEGGAILLRGLTSLVTLILNGKTPDQIWPYCKIGATLVALRKKDGGRYTTKRCWVHTAERLAAKFRRGLSWVVNSCCPAPAERAGFWKAMWTAKKKKKKKH